MPRRCPMPSEKLLAFFRDTAVSPTVSRTSVTRPLGDPVRLGQTEEVVVGAATAVHRLRVEERADVAEGVLQLGVVLAVDPHRARGRAMRPSIIRIVVDLPAPFGPRKPVTMPGCTVNVRLLTAVFSPYRSVSPSELDHAATLKRAKSPPATWGRGASGRRGTGVSGTAEPAPRARSARPRPAHPRRRPPHR